MQSLFRVHDWRNDVVNIGEVPAEMVREASDGKVSEPWPAQLNKLIWNGGHDMVRRPFGVSTCAYHCPSGRGRRWTPVVGRRQRAVVGAAIVGR
jgi:hypothetical protein